MGWMDNPLNAGLLCGANIALVWTTIISVFVSVMSYIQTSTTLYQGIADGGVCITFIFFPRAQLIVSKLKSLERSDPRTEVCIHPSIQKETVTMII